MDMILPILPNGIHLINKTDDTYSIKYNIIPDYAALSAAAQSLECKLQSILLKASNPYVLTRLTDVERDKLERVLKEINIDRYNLPSISNIVDSFLNALLDKSKEFAFDNPCVIETRNNYITALLLSKK